MTPLEQAFSCLEQLVNRGGEAIRPADHERLLTVFNSVEQFPGEVRLGELQRAAMKGFFHCAAAGTAFVPADRIKEYFGRSLEENYPGAAGAFLRFATSYWTLKLVVADLAAQHRSTRISRTLGYLDFKIGSVFFPTPGIMSVPTSMRSSGQREMILDSGAPINLDEFLSGNPILAAGGRSGCVVIIALSLLFWKVLSEAL